MAISFTFIRLVFSVMLKYIPMLINHRLSAIRHRLTYTLLPPSSLRNVVVIGGSYTGIHLAKRLAESLPTGFKVVLIERKSHFNHLFNLPRYSVVKGRESTAFIPYDGVAKESLIPKGIFERVEGSVTRIGSEEVEIKDGEKVPFAYLAVCTGATLPRPATLRSTSKEGCCEELKDIQSKIERAGKIAVVGGGAVGVQISGDIKSFYPEKEVVLVHSRARLLNGFGENLGSFVAGKLEGMGVRVILGERPVIKGMDGGLLGEGELLFKDGRPEDFDLVIPCTGQVPNSTLISDAYPSSISPNNNRILVTPTLQLSSPSALDPPPPANIFALGDVAETPGPKMARAGMTQADVVRENICSLIKGEKLKEYVPTTIEGALSLTLGKDESVQYMIGDDGKEFLMPGKGKGIDLEVGRMWGLLGAKMDVKEIGNKVESHSS